ncbi:LacI family DNA-binding transcriptional regulator [Variovorax sp.]|jgi:LacI family transcriptional regulator|uniref:LacI family DNA-binding transcriptional regulator n=1 Tax=Variovorax sp. TaxID=1871043 RepID=UPI00120FAFA1|nr:substrate-binding domain-containing protein [Variovorax sp.]TAJ61937.1 MAG: LacI family DNA-binding transcriptional regulator [Variovorax sp.]
MKPKAGKASIKDVATLAGVSLGSVSRVINKVENVSPALRERVERAMRELDYRLNHAAQALRSRSSRTVGCMFTDVANPLYAKLYRTFEAKLREAGYMVLLANSLNDPQWELEILAMFQGRRMDGVIIAPGNERDPAVLEAVEKLGIPAVILDRDMDVAQDQLLFDHPRGVKEAVLHLASLGHREMGLVVADMQNRPMRRRIEGFEAGLEASGLAARPAHIVRLPTSTSPAFDAVTQLLEGAVRPTALVTLGTSVLADVLNAIAAQGLRIPQDISLVTLGDPDFARSHHPPISSVTVDLDRAAEDGVRMLLERMRDAPDAPPRRVLAPMQFVLRGSCGPVPAQAAPKPRKRAA